MHPTIFDKHWFDSTPSLRPLTLASICLLAVACGASQNDDNTAMSNGSSGATGASGATGGQIPGGSGATGVAGASQSGAGNTPGGAGGSAPGGASGAAPTGGSAGAPIGGAGGAAGSNTGGQAGTAGTAGSAGTAGAPGGTGMDSTPTHPLMVLPSACSCTIAFSATELDPMAGTSPTPTHAGDQQKGRVDASKPIKGKLVMTMGGIGGGPGQGGINGYAEGLGFHTLQIAYQTNESSAPDDPYKNKPEDMRTDEDNRQMGDARMEAFDGVDRVDWLDINRSDSFERRTELALVHMQEQDPGGDWAYYLNADGTVRWSDVWLVGYSYGSQTLAVWAKYIRFGRGIATSGPANEGFPNALWIKENPGATPLDRMYMLVGSSDVGNKVETVLAAGWLGPSMDVSGGVAADFFASNPHVFVLQGQGHGEFCAGDGGTFKNLCDYAFGALQP